MRLDTPATERQAEDPDTLGAFRRWQDPRWKRLTLSLRQDDDMQQTPFTKIALAAALHRNPGYVTAVTDRRRCVEYPSSDVM